MGIRDAFRKANQTVEDARRDIERGRQQADEVAQQRTKRQNRNGEKK